MEETLNSITLVGTLFSAPVYSHSNHGRRFYSLLLEVSRLSGAVDTLPVIVPDALLSQAEAACAEAVRITGQIRTFNSREASGRRLLVSVYAETLEAVDAAHENHAELLGVLCKPPVYRRTPLGREICDMMLAVNRPYRRADYIPCILWGRQAQQFSDISVGTTLLLCGRLQSRSYTKLLDGEPQARVAYELSVTDAQVARE